MSARTNSQFLAASVTEFISVWAVGGDASLNLTTKGGFTTIGFNCTIGHPGAPHSLPSPPSSAPSFPPPLLAGLATVGKQRGTATSNVLPGARTKLGKDNTQN